MTRGLRLGLGLGRVRKGRMGLHEPLCDTANLQFSFTFWIRLQLLWLRPRLGRLLVTVKCIVTVTVRVGLGLGLG